MHPPPSSSMIAVFLGWSEGNFRKYSQGEEYFPTPYYNQKDIRNIAHKNRQNIETPGTLV